MKKLFVFLALLPVFTLKSQTSPVCDSTTWAKEGTYEIIPLSKVKEVFTTDLLCVIEANRKELESFDLQISPITIIRIHPRKKVLNNSSTK